MTGGAAKAAPVQYANCNMHIAYYIGDNMIDLDLMQYADLPIGSTVKGPCPECGKAKFYVTRKPQSLAYICFRASCTLRPGHVPTSDYVPPDWTMHVCDGRPKGRVYRGALHQLTEADVDYFVERFKLARGQAVHMRRTDDGRYALRVYDRTGNTAGWVIRQPWPAAPIESQRPDAPKTINYLDKGERHAWYGEERADLAILVEDQISALRLDNLYRGEHSVVALLGTRISANLVRDLAYVGVKQVIVALDPDAYSTSISLCSQLRGQFEVSAARLDYDPKDYPCNYALRAAIAEAMQ